MLTISYVVAYWKNGNTEARPNQLSQILATNIDSGLRGFRPRIFVSYCLKNKLNLTGLLKKLAFSCLNSFLLSFIECTIRVVRKMNSTDNTT